MTGDKRKSDGVLTPPEKKALADYDAWVEEDLGGRTGSLVKLFLAAAVAAMVIIAAILVWQAGAPEEGAPNDAGSVSLSNPQEKPAGIRLVYRIDGPPGSQHVWKTIDVIRQRLEGLHYKFSISWEKSHGEIHIEFPGAAGLNMAYIKNIIAELGWLLFALEATEEELKDPEKGLGPKFDPEKFLKDQENDRKVRMQYAPKLYDEAYTGEAVPLYRNPVDFRKPKKPGDRPAFIYFPPNRWKSKKNGKWRGPKTGAIVRMGEEVNFHGEDIVKISPTVSQQEQVAVFEFSPEKKYAFQDFTKKNVKRNLCIIFNEKLLTRPVINSTLPGSGVIQGIGEQEDIEKLVISVRSGRLGIKPVLVREEKFHPKKR